MNEQWERLFVRSAQDVKFVTVAINWILICLDFRFLRIQLLESIFELLFFVHELFLRLWCDRYTELVSRRCVTFEYETLLKCNPTLVDNVVIVFIIFLLVYRTKSWIGSEDSGLRPMSSELQPWKIKRAGCKSPIQP